MKKANNIIMGTAFSLATLAIAIDHSKHPLPEPSKAQTKSPDGSSSDKEQESENPCSLNPCSLNPCSL